MSTDPAELQLKLLFQGFGAGVQLSLCSAADAPVALNFTRSASSLALSCTYVHRMQGKRREGLVPGQVGWAGLVTTQSVTAQ